MKALPLALSLLAALLAIATSANAQVKPPPKAEDCVVKQGEMLQSWNGVAFAIDGDTLAGIGLKPHIRIWGIQAPELRDKDKDETVPGMRARATLSDLLAKADGKVWCRAIKYDRYCRLVAQCNVPTDPAPGSTSPTPLDIGLYMVMTGYAYGFYLDDVLPWDAGAGVRYNLQEARARERKAGLWPLWLGEK